MLLATSLATFGLLSQNPSLQHQMRSYLQPIQVCNRRGRFTRAYDPVKASIVQSKSLWTAFTHRL